jgi:hypothetical protein
MNGIRVRKHSVTEAFGRKKRREDKWSRSREQRRDLRDRGTSIKGRRVYYLVAADVGEEGEPNRGI